MSRRGSIVLQKSFGMHDRLIQCINSGFETGVGTSDEELVKFYNNQTRRVQRVCSPASNASTVVEVEIDEATVGQVFGRCVWNHS